MQAMLSQALAESALDLSAVEEVFVTMKGSTIIPCCNVYWQGSHGRDLACNEALLGCPRPPASDIPILFLSDQIVPPAR